MGAYRSIFETTAEDRKTKLSPNKGDWITGHADLTGLAVVEVQRLWVRFNQLNCDSKGNLPKKQIEKGELSRDIFIKNIVANLPKEKDGSLSFLVFLKFMQWIDTASIEQKLKLIFHFLNNGDEITEDVVEKLFFKVYPNSDEKEINDLIKLFMEQLDPDMTKKINEKNFIQNILANYDREELNYLLKYDLIPADVLREMNMQPSLPGSQLNMRSTNVSNAKSELSDELLESVARKVVKKEWEELALSLGFTKREIELYKSKFNDIDYDTILAMMCDWRDQDPKFATKNRLKNYLEELRMNDAAALMR